MAFSMTGFGRGEAKSDARSFTVEIRSVNHRYCDISIRMPRQFAGHEDKIRQCISQRLNRGKIDAFVSFEEYGGHEREVIVDIELAKSYMEAAEAIKSQFSLRDDVTVSSILRVPDIFKVKEAAPDEDEVWELLEAATGSALDALAAMRSREGGKLISDVSLKLETLSRLVDQVEARAPYVTEEYRGRLGARLKELSDQNMPDENRVAAEIAMFAERCSIDEEITRFKSHIAQAANCCSSKEPVGRKLDFILQEINREINTIGSKANDMAISGLVVDMKSEAEKIREQIQNLE